MQVHYLDAHEVDHLLHVMIDPNCCELGLFFDLGNLSILHRLRIDLFVLLHCRDFILL